MTGRIPVARAQQRLATLWVAGGITLMLVVMLQSAGGIYLRVSEAVEIDDTTAVWQWLLPTFLPTLSLMVGTLAAEAQRKGSEATASIYAFRLCFALSVTYLLLLAAQLLLQSRSYSVDALGASAIFLTPLQGLVGLSLGAFFVSRESPHESTRGAAPDTAARTE